MNPEDRKYKKGQQVEFYWKGDWIFGFVEEPHPDFMYDPRFYDIRVNKALYHIPEEHIF